MNTKRSILVTGASSGIGKETALYLDKMGFMVFAGVRKDEDKIVLEEQGSNKLRAIILDVTLKDTISNTVDVIEKEKEYPFYGLVNNAGVGLRGVLEATPEEEVRKVFEVNVIGLHAVTRAFLPLLRKNGGRIVNIGSEAGFMAGPSGSAYSASKFAVRAISDSLRLELIPFDIFISYVAPTSTHSEIWDKNTEYRNKLNEQVSRELFEAYGFFFKAGDREVVELVKPIPTIEVAKDIAHALVSTKPKYEYCSGEKSQKAYRMSLLPKAFSVTYMLKRLTKFMKKYA
ncbi:SDR family NAD(P)-dependent oxidoreductase [bacterium]|nr:SDR family NAD(P)-dependent oxidoreductase [bacterium]MBU1958898.1 SDR family NAD(P)-dependent oxidoreductase [bacterium]